jgi:hypothetical protein
VATLSVISWRENAVGFTGWDEHSTSETKRRLKRAIDASPELVRQYLRRIRDRELLTIDHIKDDAVSSVRQILETQGAEVLVAQDRPA